ncbi:MAG TPA: glutaredoxin domain-containing protein [Acidimicrobiales bacterium]|nr:glutaredoxin domain-containing protein [Acidimicrobiales bacterium]
MRGRIRDGATPSAGSPAVVVYWRPGCPFCARLRWGLRRMDVASDELNIWGDPSAAAFVRSVNGGDETVPTVLVGATTMRNPTPRQVRREIQRQSLSFGAE